MGDRPPPTSCWGLAGVSGDEQGKEVAGLRQLSHGRGHGLGLLWGQGAER